MKFENLKLKNIELGVRFTPNQEKWIAKNRKFHIIGVELGGLSVHDFGFERFTLKKNSLYFFNQKDDYSVAIKEKGESLSIHFTTYEDIETDSFHIKEGATAEIIAILERIISKSRDQSENELLITQLFYKLCVAIEISRKKSYSPKSLRMINAKEHIEQNYMGKSCVDEAAEICGVTRRRFNDLFKNSFNITPNRYIIKLRTEYAKHLLDMTNLQITQIAENCGFTDVYYFSKTFKSETGQTPSDYRNRK